MECLIWRLLLAGGCAALDGQV